MSNETSPTDHKNLFHRHLPILTWLPKYKPSWLRHDLIAGLTIWAVLVPEAMAYAGIAGVPPIMGLYTIPIPLFLYAIFGTSRTLVVGPDSAACLISASAVGALAACGAAEYLALTTAMAIAVGVFLIVFGTLRMGWIADFISIPVMAGFLEGVILVTIIGQVPKLFGIDGDSGNFFQRLLVIVQGLPDTNLITMILGVGSLVLIVAIGRYLSKLPAAFTTIIISIVAVSALNLTTKGVDVVGTLSTGLPPISLPDASLTDYMAVIPGALAIVLLGYIETLGAAAGAASKEGGRIDPDQELVALGTANLGAGLSSGFVVAGSLSKTSVAMRAGGKTQISHVVSGILAILTLLVLMPLFTNLPEATLAAIVIVAMVGLDQTAKLKKAMKFSRTEFTLGMICFTGVLTLGVLEGVGLGVVLSLLVLIKKACRPGTAVLGRVPGERTYYRDIRRRPDAETMPGLLIFRFDARLIFFNCNFFASEVKRCIAKAREPVKTVLIDAEAMNDIDITGADRLIKLNTELNRRNIVIFLTHVRDPLRDKMHRMGVVDAIGSGHIYETTRDGVDAFVTSRDMLPATENNRSP
ncbi:MAG: SulP family inorganic anion transporter [ANME-2 cluster archaeon]|jgi:high affinity sulfate transporter 1|nr:MAG: SulP family inorganic anion transporter [ANME-2 cluster archaeon]